MQVIKDSLAREINETNILMNVAAQKRHYMAEVLQIEDRDLLEEKVETAEEAIFEQEEKIRALPYLKKNIEHCDSPYLAVKLSDLVKDIEADIEQTTVNTRTIHMHLEIYELALSCELKDALTALDADTAKKAKKIEALQKALDALSIY